jgi:hypothetical protein
MSKAARQRPPRASVALIDIFLDGLVAQFLPLVMLRTPRRDIERSLWISELFR